MLISSFFTGNFSFYTLLPNLFSLEIFILACLLLKSQEKRSCFRTRFFAILTLIVAYCLFVPPAGRLIPSSIVFSIYFPLRVMTNFTVRYLVAVLALFFLYRIKFTSVLFIVTICCCVQNIGSNIVSIIFNNIVFNSLIVKNIVFSVIFLSVFSLLYFIVFKFYTYRTKGAVIIELKTWQVTVFVVVTLLISNYFHQVLLNVIPKTGDKIVGRVVLSLCDGLIIFIQIETLMSDRLSHEMRQIQMMWKKDKESYELNRRSFELLNVQIHDFKNILGRIDSGNVKEFARGFEDAILDYDALIRTGNEALDVILNEKNLYCRKNGIEFTVMADGKALEFMSNLDIYSLFGNILNNAVEGVEKLADNEQKVISMTVIKEAENVVIEENNVCPETVVFKDGLPVTTKADKSAHGFGTKSIGMIVNKYNGMCCFSVKDGVFYLEIVIPNK